MPRRRSFTCPVSHPPCRHHLPGLLAQGAERRTVENVAEAVAVSACSLQRVRTDSRWDVNLQSVKLRISEIRKQMGKPRSDLQTIARLAEPRIQTMLPLLPLKGRRRMNTRRPAERLSPECLTFLRHRCDGATGKQGGALLRLPISMGEGRLSMICEHLAASNRYEITLRAWAAGYLDEGNGTT